MDTGTFCFRFTFIVDRAGFELSKNKSSAYSLSLSLHTGNSASLTTAKLISQGILFGGGVEQTTGGVQPPGNSNTEIGDILLEHAREGARAMHAFLLADIQSLMANWCPS
jgi:hypothetical protein